MCPRYKIVVVVGHNGVKSLPEVASKMSSNKNSMKYVVSKLVNFPKLYPKHVAALAHKYGPFFVRFFIFKFGTF